MKTNPSMKKYNGLKFLAISVFWVSSVFQLVSIVYGEGDLPLEFILQGLECELHLFLS